MHRGQLAAFAFALVSLAGCGEEGVAIRPLDAPEGTQSVAWGIVRGQAAEVSLRSIDAAVEVDASSPVTLSVRFFEESLEELGVSEGVLTPRTTEPVFGRLPPGIGDVVRVLDRGEDSEWVRAEPAELLDTFASPDLPPDPYACVDLEIARLLQIPGGGLVTGVAAESPTSAIVFVQREQGTSLQRLALENEEWTLSELELAGFETVLSSSVTGAGLEDGGVWLSTCDPSAGTTRTATVWSLTGDTLEPVLTGMGPSCPTKLLPPTALHPELVLLNGFEHDVQWYEDTIGGWKRTQSATISGDRIVRGEGDTLFSVTPGEPFVYRLDGRTTEHAEPIETGPGENLRGLMMSPWGPLVVGGEGGVFANLRVYVRRSEDEWERLFSIYTQYWITSTPFQAGVMVTGYSGSVRQVSLREGHCVPDEAFTTGVWRGNHLTSLDPYLMVVAGEAIADHTEHVVGVIRARSR